MWRKKRLNLALRIWLQMAQRRSSATDIFCCIHKYTYMYTHIYLHILHAVLDCRSHFVGTVGIFAAPGFECLAVCMFLLGIEHSSKAPCEVSDGDALLTYRAVSI